MNDLKSLRSAETTRLETQKNGHIIATALTALVSTLAIISVVNVSDNGCLARLQEVFPITPGCIILVVAISVSYFRFGLLSSFNATDLIVSAALSICTVLGRSFDKYGNLSFVTHDQFYLVISLLFLFGYWALFYFFLKCLKRIYKRLISPNRILTLLKSSHLFDSNLRTFFAAVIIIALCWLPWIIVSYPGSPSHDFLQQLRQFYGAAEPSNHHPWAMTLIFGCLYNIGYYFGGTPNVALFTVAIAQTVCMILSLAYFTYWFKRLNCNELILSLMILLFALCPIFPLYSQYCIKDTFNTILLTHFVFQIFLKLKSAHQANLKSVYFSWPSVIIVGLLCSLSRHNCIYIVLPTLFLCAFCLVKRRQVILCIISALVILASYGLWNNIVLPTSNIGPTNNREAFSLPIVQVVRCYDLRSDGFSEDELNLLQDLSSSKLDQLAKDYSIKISDSVKNAFWFEDGDLARFLKLYIDAGLRNPDIYLNTALAHSFGYWYPDATDRFSRFPYEYAPISPTNIPETIKSLAKTDQVDLNSILYDINSPFLPQKAALRSALTEAAQLPFVSLVFSAGFYIWTCFTLILATVRNCRNMIPIAIPVLLMFLVCCVSPLNGSMRYALFFVFFAPILLGMLYFAHSAQGSRQCASQNDKLTCHHIEDDSC